LLLISFQIIWPFNVNNEQLQPLAPDKKFFMSIDGTHCRISEPRKEPSAGNYSHKLNKPAVAYEIGIEIDDNKIIHVNGPYPAGSCSDVNIFRQPGGLKEKLPPGKKVIADRGYTGEIVLSTPNPLDSKPLKTFKSRARARHESLNKKVKDYKILEHRFRHPLMKHKTVFEAIITIIQYDLDNGSTLFAI
jgi:DDE superfamily endonuclease